ncbi:hypothetical protein [Halorientalis halophila]|uniref:hypothetical protein n=1 Tax=Halorientalis halophila TaxID=3108499 RepID=UPI00300AD4DD
MRSRLSFRSVSAPWILALVLTKAGDLTTTILGLVVVDGLTERNPVAAAIVARFGIVGLCWLTLVVLGVVVLVVEFAARIIERDTETDLSGDAAYLLGYLPLVALFTLATVYNAVLLCVRTFS